MSDQQKIIEVAIGVVQDGEQVLLTRRPPGVHLEGLWEFPGGKVKLGETREDCVCREVMEETGLTIEIVRSLASYVHAYPERTVHLHFLECKPVGGVLNPSLQEARWFPIRLLPSLEMPPANAPVIAMLSQEY